MTTQEIVAKLWNLCGVLWDDGITYQDYVTELTYLLFLKMANETGTEEGNIPEDCRWEKLTKLEGMELLEFYRELLTTLGKKGSGKVKDIYNDASSNIRKPASLRTLVVNIDALDWYSARHEGLGDLYEGLLEKNAGETKSGAGQYFTPRPLIDVMTKLTAPQAGDLCNDPACGTFGFMIAAFRYVAEHTKNFKTLDADTANFEIKKAFTGCELVPETRRLALMNEMLHGIEGDIALGDTLSEFGKKLKGYDVVLTNPPFGMKKGERVNRDDFTFTTNNKQLNFLQHIYRSLNKSGKARAAVVLPDNVLFADGEGVKIRRDLMAKCNLHTVLRLPTGIFYAPGVKTNVLFFTRGSDDEDNTKEVWFYDLRTDMPSFGKKNPLTVEHFNGFVAAYQAKDRAKVQDERWTKMTREEIAAKGDSLDLGLKQEENAYEYDDLPATRELAQSIAEDLHEAGAVIQEIDDLLAKV